MIGEKERAKERLKTAHLDSASMTVAEAMMRYGACRQAVLNLRKGVRWAQLSWLQQRYHPEIAPMSVGHLEERMAALGMNEEESGDD